MTQQLPPGLSVRYDYHDHPRGISAVLTSKSTGAILAVGFAKYNPRDPEFRPALGENIALGRALARLRHPFKNDHTGTAALYPYIQRSDGALDLVPRRVRVQ